MISTSDYTLYVIDTDYLKYLYSIDNEVYYNPRYHTRMKPFIGIITGIKNYKYFIPLTSAKPKHKKWKNVSNEHFLIYKVIKHDIKDNGKSHYILKKSHGEGLNIHILSVLDIKKMIPLAKDCYQKIDIENIKDNKYQDLLRDELEFCKEHKHKILDRVEKFYNLQIESKTITFASCNFTLLEKAMKKYEKEGGSPRGAQLLTNLKATPYERRTRK